MPPDRRRAGDRSVDGGPHPAPRRHVAPPALGAADHRRAVRARSGGRSAPPRHQEARPDHLRGPPDDGRPSAAAPRRRLGVVHVAVDDHSSVAYVELLPNERTETVRGFVRRVGWFRARGVRIRRLLTDNGSAYLSRGFRATCRALRVRHRRTRPYTPRTNAKPNASSRPSCASGRTPARITLRPIGSAWCRGGWSTTTAPDRIRLWESSPHESIPRR